MSQYDPNNTDPSAWPNTVRPGDPIPPGSVVGNSELWRGKPKKRRHILRNIAFVIGGMFMLLIVAAVLTPGSPDSKAPVTVTSQAGTPVDNGPTPDPVVTPTSKPSVAKPAPKTTQPKVTSKPAPKLTLSQEQAIGSAENYLSFTAFSRKGLIKQLSSEYGEGFSVKDATFAVDYLKVDWNAQAAAKAKEYLATQHFSRKGLIQQLESAYGEQFTHAQAVYGVNKAGL